VMHLFAAAAEGAAEAAEGAGGIQWDPAIRGILIVALATAILCGSVYLLLSTNSGPRLGFLIAGAGLMAWMVLMGITWWLYAIGPVGPGPEWVVQEIVRSEAQDDLGAAALPEARDLSDWEELSPEDPARGEAQAEADEMISGDGDVAQFETASDYIVLDVFIRGGKDPDSIVSRFPGPHPPQHAIVQVQQIVEQEVEFGEAPPPAEADPTEPVYSVVMVRDLGSERLPPAVFTISSLVLFLVLCNMLHRRDKLATETRARAAAEVA
jgi:hypothetical protein